MSYLSSRLLFALIVLLPFLSSAQVITLLKDIRPGSSYSSPQQFKKANDQKIFFFANDPQTGNRSLFKTDGTAAGTELVFTSLRPVLPPDFSYDRNTYVTLNGNLLFKGYSGNNANQMWWSDGTSNGTYPLTAFNGMFDLVTPVLHNNQLHFFAWFTQPDGVFRSNMQSLDAQRILSFTDFNQRFTKLDVDGGQLYRHNRNTLFRIQDTTETQVFTDGSSCIGENTVVNGYLIYNRISCSTVDPTYLSLNAVNLTTGASNILSTSIRIGGRGNTPNTYSVNYNGKYYTFRDARPFNGPGSMTSQLYIYSTNGVTVDQLAFHKTDSSHITFNGFYEANNKLYYSFIELPQLPGQTNNKKFRLFEINGNSSSSFFEFTDISSNHRMRHQSFAIRANDVVFIADSTSSNASSNVLKGSGNTFSKVFLANSIASERFSANSLIGRDSAQVLISGIVFGSVSGLGEELYQLTNSTGSTSNLADISWNQLKVYPNPVSGGEFIVEITAINSPNLAIQLYDLQGRLVKDYGLHQTDGSKRFTIDGVKPGLYFLRFQHGTNSHQRKLVVQ